MEECLEKKQYQLLKKIIVIYYLKKEINYFCKYLGISKSQFFSICNKIRNKTIWKKNNRNKWIIKNFLIEDFNWKK